MKPGKKKLLKIELGKEQSARYKWERIIRDIYDLRRTAHTACGYCQKYQSYAQEGVKPFCTIRHVCNVCATDLNQNLAMDKFSNATDILARSAIDILIAINEDIEKKVGTHETKSGKNKSRRIKSGKNKSR